MRNLFFLLLILSSALVQSQSIQNSVLDAADYNKFTTPYNWVTVPANDPTNVGTVVGTTDTPDMTGVNQKYPEIGVSGIPHSGDYFVSGALQFYSTQYIYHEGIMQQVHNLEIGKAYSVDFWQSVVKQKDLESNNGCWYMYLDNEFVGKSKGSISTKSVYDENLDWEYRSIDFIAKDSVHYIKFLPHVDSSLALNSRNVRMGIDDITLVSCRDSVSITVHDTIVHNVYDTTTVSVSDTLSIYLSQIITSVNNASQAATTVKVYPNPVAQNLTVEIDNYANLSGVYIKVLDTQSVEVHNQAVIGSIQSINVSNWSAGVYFLHIMNGSTTVDIKKIVVNN